MKKVILILSILVGLVNADEFSSSQKEVLAKAIELSGYTCGYVNSARIGYDKVITAYCDDYKTEYELVSVGGNWSIKAIR